MRILHVAPTAFGDEGLFGGGERYPLELARALHALDGVDCELVTFGPRARRTEVDGLPVRVLRPIGRLGGHPAHPIAPALVGALAGADVVHTHHLRAAPSRMAAVVARARRQRVAVTDHGLGGGDWGGLLPRLVDRFLTVSAYSAEVLGAPPERTTVIFGGADPDRFAPGDDDRSGVLFVGRMTPHKGIDRLIAAVPPDVRLTIAGTPGHDRDLPEREYPELLRRLAAGRDVEFVVAPSDDDLADLYRRAAVVAVPSVHVTCYGAAIAVSELLGLSTIEAMASGTPVVASRLGGLAEVVVDGETGFLVEPGDIDALGDRIGLLLGDPALARRLGEGARARVLERFTWDACARRCRDAYDELLAGRR
jgi:glycosyltransferase involved in cell wall biosynthesis